MKNIIFLYIIFIILLAPIIEINDTYFKGKEEYINVYKNIKRSLNTYKKPIKIRQEFVKYELQKEYPELADELNNNFVTIFAGGLTDQVGFAFVSYKIYVATGKKYKFIFNDVGGAHGDNIIKHFNFDKYIDYELKKISNEVFDVYYKYGSYLGYSNIFSYITTDFSELTPPFLDAKRYIPYQSDEVPIFQQMMKLKTPLNAPNKQKLKQIKQTENSVSVHIRMGDVLAPDGVGSYVNKRQYVVKLSYIKDSIIKMAKQILEQKKEQNITFFVFSNSMNLVKARLNEKELKLLIQEIKKTNKKANITFDFVEINKDGDAHFELELMKNCQHFIVSAGGFSYLGSILGEYKDKIVITPNESEMSSNKIKDNFMEKEIEWGYRWDYKSNNWRNITILTNN